MNEDRVNAAIAELTAINQALTQRIINLAGDLAEARAEIEALKELKWNPDGTNFGAMPPSYGGVAPLNAKGEIS